MFWVSSSFTNENERSQAGMVKYRIKYDDRGLRLSRPNQIKILSTRFSRRLSKFSRADPNLIADVLNKAVTDPNLAADALDFAIDVQ